MTAIRRGGAIVVGTVVALALAGCGVVFQTSAQPISVPANQFQAQAPKPSSTHDHPVDVFFLSNGHLVASTRYLGSGHLGLVTELQDALDALCAGPTTAELRAGATTAISVLPLAQVTVLGSVKKGVVSVVLDKTFNDLDATQLYEADGQIVYTLTQFVGVTAVSFVFDGVKEAWLPDGSVLFGQSVGEASYKAISPLAP